LGQPAEGHPAEMAEGKKQNWNFGSRSSNKRPERKRFQINELYQQVYAKVNLAQYLLFMFSCGY
jgi:hypothetical protein